MLRGFSRKPKQRRREKRAEIPFERVTATIRLDSSRQVVEGRVFLNDLSPKGVGCFVPVSFEKGDSVSVVIDEPKHLFVKGQILWCKPYNLESKVLSNEHFPFRIGIKFQFDSDKEAEAIQTYCSELYAEPTD